MRIYCHFMAIGLIIGLFPAELPPNIVMMGGTLFGVGFVMWRVHVLRKGGA